MKEADVQSGAATATLTAPTITPIPDGISQPAQPERTTTQPKTERPKPRYKDLYNKVGYTLAIVASFGIAGLCWYIGAYYTLRGLSVLGLNTTSGAWWALPTLITAVELWLMPKRGTRWQAVAVFMLILGFDVLTSWFGLITDVAGRSLPLGAGITLPEGGVVLHALCVVLSLIFAFIPEKLGRWAYRELIGTWL